MSAVAQRFGSGQSVRRIEDPALVAGKGQFTDDVSLPGQTFLSMQRSPYPHARIVAIDTARRAGAARRAGGLHRRRPGGRPASSRWARSRCSPAPAAPRRRRRRAMRWRWTRCASSARRWWRWSADSADAARAGRDAVVVDYDELPNVVHLDDAVAAGAPKVWADAADNYRRRDAPRQGRGLRRGLRQGRARGRAGPGEPAAGADLAGAAHGARQLRRRPRDAAHEQPDARRRARHAVQRGLRLAHRQAARGGRRCRRRLRHEDRRLPRGHRRRLLHARAAAAGEVGVRAQRGVPRRQPRPRHAQPCRAGAGRRRPRARPARAVAGQRRRLCHDHRRDHPAADRARG